MPAPIDEPIGLDMSIFNHVQPQQTNIQNEKDMEIIKSIEERHSTVMSVINRRMSSMKVILKWWSQGNISSAINALQM